MSRISQRLGIMGLPIAMPVWLFYAICTACAILGAVTYQIMAWALR